MNEDQLKRALKSVGYACFASHREILLDATIPQEVAAQQLKTASPKWSVGGCNIRVRHARNILKFGCVDDAMTLIAKSKIDPALARIADRWGLQRL